MELLIKNGYILDPETGREGIYDLLIKNDKIIKVAKNINEEVHNRIDVKGKLVMPGFIDLHVHLREPGYEYKETIYSGSKAAARGGFTTICAMPNTNPVIDNKYMVEYMQLKSMKEAVVHVIPVGAITKGQHGAVLADIDGMAEAGVKALSEDGKSVMNTSLYLKGMEAAKKANLLIMAHCEDKDLVGEGVINEGIKSQEYGLKGISNAVEDIIVARDILLSKYTGVDLHLCHCSTRDSVHMIASAKKEGISVTGEVCPHHFTLSHNDIEANHGNFKMNPPLRSKEDVQALKEGLRDNIIDVIATDHAPHGIEENNQSFSKSPFGIVGLETAFALTVTELLEPGYLTLMQMAEKLSFNPSRILGINKGSLKEGRTADIVIADIEMEYRIDSEKFLSKGKNTPFHGKKVRGTICMTIVDGEIVFKQDGVMFS